MPDTKELDIGFKKGSDLSVLPFTICFYAADCGLAVAGL